jgi:hypothetical protein
MPCSPAHLPPNIRLPLLAQPDQYPTAPFPFPPPPPPPPQLLPSVTELVVAQCYYLDFDDRNRQRPIYVYLNSTGCINDKGQAVSADNEFYAIWAALGFTRAPLYTGVTWKAQNQAAVLLAAGQKGHRWVGEGEGGGAGGGVGAGCRWVWGFAWEVGVLQHHVSTVLHVSGVLALHHPSALALPTLEAPLRAAAVAATDMSCCPGCCHPVMCCHPPPPQVLLPPLQDLHGAAHHEPRVWPGGGRAAAGGGAGVCHQVLRSHPGARHR